MVPRCRPETAHPGPPGSACGFYGFAAFNLSWQTGQAGRYRTAYGHLGATYGYQLTQIDLR